MCYINCYLLTYLCTYYMKYSCRVTNFLIALTHVSMSSEEYYMCRVALEPQRNN